LPIFSSCRRVGRNESIKTVRPPPRSASSVSRDVPQAKSVTDVTREIPYTNDTIRFVAILFARSASCLGTTSTSSYPRLPVRRRCRRSAAPRPEPSQRHNLVWILGPLINVDTTRRPAPRGNDRNTFVPRAHDFILSVNTGRLKTSIPWRTSSDGRDFRRLVTVFDVVHGRETDQNDDDGIGRDTPVVVRPYYTAGFTSAAPSGLDDTFVSPFWIPTEANGVDTCGLFFVQREPWHGPRMPVRRVYAFAGPIIIDRPSRPRYCRRREYFPSLFMLPRTINVTTGRRPQRNIHV